MTKSPLNKIILASVFMGALSFSHSARADDEAKAIIGGILEAIVSEGIKEMEKSSQPPEPIEWNDPPKAPAEPAPVVKEEVVESEVTEEEPEQATVQTASANDDPYYLPENFFSMSDDERSIRASQIGYKGVLEGWETVVESQRDSYIYLWSAYMRYVRIKSYHEAREGEFMVYVNDSELEEARKAVKDIEAFLLSRHPELDTEAVWELAVEDTQFETALAKDMAFEGAFLDQADNEIHGLNQMRRQLLKLDGHKEGVEKDF